MEFLNYYAIYSLTCLKIKLLRGGFKNNVLKTISYFKLIYETLNVFLIFFKFISRKDDLQVEKHEH